MGELRLRSRRFEGMDGRRRHLCGIGGAGELANNYETESYFTIDAKIAYETERYAAAINVKNLTGEEYFVPYNYFNGRVAPGDDRAVYGTLKYKY